MSCSTTFRSPNQRKPPTFCRRRHYLRKSQAPNRRGTDPSTLHRKSVEIKWKFKFVASKSSTVSFTWLYKPRDDPLLFLNGHRMPNAPKIKFLGLILDAKLLWKDHISMVVNKCTRLKNVFSIISKASYAPNIPKPVHPLQELSPQPHRIRTTSLRLRQQNPPTENRHHLPFYPQNHTWLKAIHAHGNYLRRNGYGTCLRQKKLVGNQVHRQH
jgi:hypothetical protein